MFIFGYKIVRKLLDAHKRKARLEELARKKRPGGRCRSPVHKKSSKEVYANKERIPRNAESKNDATLKKFTKTNKNSKKSRYEGDLQNLWQIRNIFHIVELML